MVSQWKRELLDNASLRRQKGNARQKSHEEIDILLQRDR